MLWKSHGNSLKRGKLTFNEFIYMYTLSLNVVWLSVCNEETQAENSTQALSQILHNFRIEYRNQNRERENEVERHKAVKGRALISYQAVKPLVALRLIFAGNMEQQKFPPSFLLLLPHSFPEMFVLSLTVCVALL